MQTRFDDLKFLQDPDQWPNRPICPVKRYGRTKQPGGFPETGLVLAGGTIVYMVNLWELAAVPSEAKARIESAEKHEYKSLEALVADGWLVD